MTSSESSSTSEEEIDSSIGGPRLKAPRFEVPACVTDLYLHREQRSNRAAEHQGRKRKVPHVEGNFATLLYLPIQATDKWRGRAELCYRALHRLIAATNPNIDNAAATVFRVDPQIIPGWHVSLSPLLMLRKHFIQPSVEQFKEAAARWTSADQVLFEDDIEIFTSNDADRFFAGAVVAEASARPLRNLAAGIHKSCEALGLASGWPPIKDMRLHCSLAWTLSDLRPALSACGAEQVQSAWGMSWRLPADERGMLLKLLSAPLSTLQLRVGDRIHKFPFASSNQLGGPEENADSDDEDS